MRLSPPPTVPPPSLLLAILFYSFLYFTFLLVSYNFLTTSRRVSLIYLNLFLYPSPNPLVGLLPPLSTALPSTVLQIYLPPLSSLVPAMSCLSRHSYPYSRTVLSHPIAPASQANDGCPKILPPWAKGHR